MAWKCVVCHQVGAGPVLIQGFIQCDFCKSWTHGVCADLTVAQAKDTRFTCVKCKKKGVNRPKGGIKRKSTEKDQTIIQADRNLRSRSRSESLPESQELLPSIAEMSAVNFANAGTPSSSTVPAARTSNLKKTEKPPAKIVTRGARRTALPSPPRSSVSVSSDAALSESRCESNHPTSGNGAVKSNAAKSQESLSIPDLPAKSAPAPVEKESFRNISSKPKIVHISEGNAHSAGTSAQSSSSANTRISSSNPVGPEPAVKATHSSPLSNMARMFRRGSSSMHSLLPKSECSSSLLKPKTSSKKGVVKGALDLEVERKMGFELSDDDSDEDAEELPVANKPIVPEMKPSIGPVVSEPSDLASLNGLVLDDAVNEDMEQFFSALPVGVSKEDFMSAFMDPVMQRRSESVFTLLTKKGGS